MTSSASTDTFPALPDDVAEVRRAAGITIAPEAALHRALQERTDELERVRAECSELRQAVATIEAAYDRAASERDSALADLLESATCLEALESERRAVLAMLPIEARRAGGPLRLVDEVANILGEWGRTSAAYDSAVSERDEARAALTTLPTAPDVGSPTSAPAAGAADPPRRRTPDEIRAWAAGLFGG